MIQTALQEHRGNRTHAAEVLGISVRTLRNKLHEYRQEMEREGFDAEEPVEGSSNCDGNRMNRRTTHGTRRKAHGKTPFQGIFSAHRSVRP